jgi:FKBP-type peptidyl-prolyl cis-trans isomerase (trigger factor)
MSKKATTPKTHTHAAGDNAQNHTHTHDHTHAPKGELHVLPNSQVTVTITWDKVEPVYQKVLQKAAHQVKMDGFRQGKVPASIAEGMLKPGALVEEVLQQILPAAYSEEIKKSQKKPISSPEIDPVAVDKGKDWVLTVYFAEVQPVELGKYQDVVKKSLKEAEKEIAEKLKGLEKADSDSKSTSKNAKKPNEASATTLSDEEKENMKMTHVFRALLENIHNKVQEILVHAEVRREIEHLLQQLRQLNLKVEDYLSSRQMNAEALQQEYAIQAVGTLRLEFILAEIAKEQKLTVEDKEIDDVLDKVADGKLSAKQRQDVDYRSYLFSTLLKQKVMKHLLALG